MYSEKEVREVGELKLVGYRILCEGDQYIVEIPKASLRLQEMVADIPYVVNPSQQFGAFVVDSVPENDGYWICVEVKEFGDNPDDFVQLTIPPQRYAVVRYNGPNDKIREAYSDLHAWMEENQYTRRMDAWHVEKFHSWEDRENIDVELFDTIA
ncbi:GyrI-like domain-containing protein [Sporosarcina sp. Te-1]|uniref:GyrI-like domain-containing protein n=1 Tax=Sporosarcina sp. Te-1 TaxID=2818390 RepID=UPI001A9E0DC4|nr:GyrI-like domain-containing protein [Sporosarcina sp. Te-1]QTD40392.1 GyrI-like domain-containing protein [Sporosarcina sp. Te-1]